MWQKFEGVWHHCHCRSGSNCGILLIQKPVRTGQTHRKTDTSSEGLAIMGLAIFFLVFLLLMAAASAAGLTADSRDGADWKPTVDGFRAPPLR
jgi:hypothetical protein